MDNNEKNDDGYSNKKYMKYKTCEVMECSLPAA